MWTFPLDVQASQCCTVPSLSLEELFRVYYKRQMRRGDSSYVCLIVGFILHEYRICVDV